MAQQTQNARGTLTPGQTISVNKYTVQVERYLSQGMHIHHLHSAVTTSISRWFRPCVSCADSYPRVRYYTPCPEENRRGKRFNVD
jgi:hypothetical protein